MLDTIAGFDALGIGAIVGSLLFLGVLLRVLLDNRSFDDLERRRSAASEPDSSPPRAPHGPRTPRRAA